MRENIISGDIIIAFVKPNDQLAYVFTKSGRGPWVAYICNELDAYDLYAPTYGGMSDIIKYLDVYNVSLKSLCNFPLFFIIKSLINLECQLKWLKY